jgi:dGTPase
MEGKVVSLSDRIAYVNHDIDDAVRAGVLKSSDVPESCRSRFGNTHSERINSMILDVLQESMGQPYVAFTPEAAREFNVLRDFMYENVYFNPIAKREDEKARGVVEALYSYYLDHIDLLPEEFLLHLGEDGAQRITADYIACMTDTYAINEYQRLFVPAAWS